MNDKELDRIIQEFLSSNEDDKSSDSLSGKSDDVFTRTFLAMIAKMRSENARVITHFSQLDRKYSPMVIGVNQQSASEDTWLLLDSIMKAALDDSSERGVEGYDPLQVVPDEVIRAFLEGDKNIEEDKDE